MRVGGRRARHLREVLRVVVGQEIRAGVIRGAAGTATVEGLEPEAVDLHFEAEASVVSVPTIDLALALPRPKVLSRLLRSIASFGVRRLELINAWRVERSYFASPRLAPERLRADLLLGVEQGAHTWLPEVSIRPRFLDWLHTVEVGESPRRRIVADPEGQETLLSQAATDRDLLIAVGPEGGWIEEERESLGAAGFTAVQLADVTLTVPDAVVAVLAQVALLRSLGAGLEPRGGAILERGRK